MGKKTTNNKNVLVGVLKSGRDLDILLKQKWYRIPVAYAPKKLYKYIAFYQPSIFGRHGKRIEYYGKILERQTDKRINLIPDEPGHPRASDAYLKIYFSWIKKLPHPIRNLVPRRISFGFTTLKRLLKSKNILELYDVAPTEAIMANALKRAGIKAIAQYRLKGKKKYCLDLAVFCKKGKIAVECDNKKAHSSQLQKKRDKTKDAFLKKNGWVVIRLKEYNIILRPDQCLAKVRRVIKKLGGLL